ncbi:tpr, partial [Cystoisospora suis]
MWLSVQEVGAARELEDRIGFCPYPHVTIDQGKVIFRVSFDDNDTRVPLPLALGFFLQHLQDKGNASQQSPLEHDVAPLVRGLSRSLRVFSRDAADSEITPPAMAAIALPSSVTPRAIRVAEAAAKLAGLTAKFLRRIDALVNFWAFENLPQDYRPLLELQKKLGVTPKTDGAVHVVLLDVGFSETSVAVLEIGRPESDSDVEHQPQQDVVCKSLCVEVDPALGFVD